jgi:hypothetical protein
MYNMSDNIKTTTNPELTQTLSYSEEINQNIEAEYLGVSSMLDQLEQFKSRLTHIDCDKGFSEENPVQIKSNTLHNKLNE